MAKDPDKNKNQKTRVSQSKIRKYKKEILRK